MAAHARRSPPTPHRDDVHAPRAAAAQSAVPRQMVVAETLLALQRTVGNRAVSRSAATLQRFPKRIAETAFADSDYPDVALEEVVKYKVYRITSPTLAGTLVYYDPDPDEGPPGYFHVDENDQRKADYSRPFKISTASAQPVAPTLFDAGENGKGVSGVAAQTKLRTKGLITCVGWLLVSPTAAYITHIVIGDPLKTKPDGIRAQVDRLYAQFERESGGKATSCVVMVGPNPAYLKHGQVGEGELAWVNELNPSGCPSFQIRRNQTELDHDVPRSEGGQYKEWDGDPIKVTES